jgi:hypothetical protein
VTESVTVGYYAEIRGDGSSRRGNSQDMTKRADELLAQARSLLCGLPSDEAEDRLVAFVAELEGRLREEDTDVGAPAPIVFPRNVERLVICQLWTESEKEPDWGVTQRPDGFSLHIDVGAHLAHVQLHWSSRDTRPEAPVPALYSFPDGPPYLARVGQELYERVVRHRSLRFSSATQSGCRQPPPPYNEHEEEMAHV